MSDNTFLAKPLWLFANELLNSTTTRASSGDTYLVSSTSSPISHVVPSASFSGRITTKLPSLIEKLEFLSILTGKLESLSVDSDDGITSELSFDFLSVPQRLIFSLFLPQVFFFNCSLVVKCVSKASIAWWINSRLGKESHLNQ
ncbi:hypothetical protein U1Q18_043679 [Sarracenia purpurea var. burkii]